jgi:hypothetical protein
VDPWVLSFFLQQTGKNEKLKSSNFLLHQNRRYKFQPQYLIFSLLKNNWYIIISNKL